MSVKSDYRIVNIIQILRNSLGFRDLDGSDFPVEGANTGGLVTPAGPLRRRRSLMTLP